MCGIAGLHLRDDSLQPQLGALLQGMLCQAAERGTEAQWDEVRSRVERLRHAADETALSREHRDLHLAMYSIAFSPRLSTVFEVHLLPYVEEAVNVGPGFAADPEGSHRQHAELVEAIAAGDAEGARRRIEELLAPLLAEAQHDV